MDLITGLDKLKKDSAEILKWIEYMRSLNDKLDDYLANQRKEWGEKMSPLYEQLNSNPELLIDVQATALSYRQVVCDEINMFLSKLSKETPKLKQAKAERFIFYSTGYGLKTTAGEKSMLFDAELAQYERHVGLLQIHIDFLRECRSNCDNIGYAIKNRLSLFAYLTSPR